MPFDETRIAAFVEYVLRPLSEDWRQILEQLRGLHIGLTPDLIRKVVMGLGLWHLMGELIRAVTYLGVTWLICQALVQVWSSP